MKIINKFFFLLSSAVLLAGCSAGMDEGFQVGEYQQISASLDQTKTTYNGTHTYWATGDQMSVFYTQKSGSIGVSCYNYTKDSRFEGTVSSLNHDKANDWYAFYPYAEGNTDVKGVTLTVPETQTQNGNASSAHIAGEVDPLYGADTDVAYGETPTLQMHHILANVKFAITNEEESEITVKKIEFTAPSNIVGSFKGDLTGSAIKWEASNSAKKVTLNVSDGTPISKGYSTSFFANILPISGSGDYTIKVTAVSGGKTIESEKTITDDMTLVAGQQAELKYTFKAEEEQGGEEQGEDQPGSYYVKVTSEPSNWEGTYLFVDENSNKAFAAFTGESGSKYATNVTINNGRIEATTELARYALTVTDAGKKHENDNVSSLEAYNVRNSEGKYVYWSSNFGEYDNATLVNDDDNKATNGDTDYYYYHTFKYSGGVQVTSAISTSGGSAYYLGYDNGFAYEKSESSNRIQLYKLDGEGGSTPSEPEQPEEPQTGDCFVKVTSEPSNWGGTYLFVDENSNKAFAAFTGESGSKYATNVTINNGRIEATTELARYALTVTDAGKKHENDNVSSLEAYNVRNSEGKYVYWSSNFGEYDNATLVNDDDNKATNGDTDYYYYHTFKYSGGVQVTSAISTGSGSAYYLGYDNGFAYEKSESSNRIQLYKLDGEGASVSGKTDQTLSFSSNTVNWTLGDGYTVGSSYDIQSVSGAKTTVTYTSSNTGVATVNGNKVTIKGAGTTTITASAAETSTYAAGSASYTLNITNGSTPSGYTFNLENSTLTNYLDDAASSYTNSNYLTTVVASYTGNSATLDLPNPVSLSWSGSATSISIYEGTSASGTAVKNQSFSSSSSVDVFNLIPGKTYSYKTSNGQTGTFNTTGRRRMIKVSGTANQDHARNCRDLGGIVTAKGDKLKYGLIYRGTNMDGVTNEEKSILKDELGIKLDVDLRGPKAKGGNDVSPLGSDIQISNKAYSSGQMDEMAADSKLQVTLIDIIDCVTEGKPAYIHCYIGSDRTGYICMLIEALLGVSKKECDIDYEITSFASNIVAGTRTKEYSDNKDFRIKFSSDADQTPQAVQKYVVETLGIPIDKVKDFRRAMGVSEEL